MAPRNQTNAQSNKTLRVRCHACGTPTSTDISNDPTQRPTWALMGVENGAPRVFAVCGPCYEKGWRPESNPGG